MIRILAHKNKLQFKHPLVQSLRWASTSRISNLDLDASSRLSISPGYVLKSRGYSRTSPVGRAQTTSAKAVVSHPDPLAEGRELARKYAEENSFDPSSLWEENIAWGHLDSFRHLNNVNYVRFFETSRMHMMHVIALETHGPDAAKAILEGHGVSIILKSIDVKFKKPVTYPDSLIMMQRAHNTSPSRFTLSSLAYSLAQRAPVATSEAICVWYDYDVSKKREVDEGTGLGAAIAKRAYKK